MSINHFSPELQETLWWSTQHQKPSSAAAAATPWPYHHHQANWPKPLPYDQRPLGLNLNYCDGGDVEDAPTTTMEEEDDELNKQHLFEKPLTPSDVGKLNRLVIPKQHAEKYFPLGADSGLLLAFEDECGKCWRFRYSYWSSSQSYVLTKGWSRYVKDKQLDAGDVILFERHRIDSDRLFIGWRRRGEDSAAASSIKEGGGGGSARVQQLQVGGGGEGEAAAGGGANWTRDFYSTHYSYPAHHVPSLPDHQQHRLSPSEPEELESRNLLPSGGGGNSRRLRLFGVNLECQMDESEPSTMQEEDSSQGLPLFSQSPSYSSSSTLYQQQYRHHQTDITFYQDVNHCHHRNFRDGRG